MECLYNHKVRESKRNGGTRSNALCSSKRNDLRRKPFIFLQSYQVNLIDKKRNAKPPVIQHPFVIYINLSLFIYTFARLRLLCSGMSLISFTETTSSTFFSGCSQYCSFPGKSSNQAASFGQSRIMNLPYSSSRDWWNFKYAFPSSMARISTFPAV